MFRSLLALIKRIFILGLAGLLAGLVIFAGVYFYFSRGLPKIASLKDYQPPIITTLYSDDGRKIAEFSKERRVVIPLSDMPENLLNAFVSAEDARFYEHSGIDLHSIIRAFFKNLEAGQIVQGGSTITQQVAKSFFLTPERSYSRKIREAILAYRIDRRFTKEEILYLYLNQIYLGHGAYGVEAASENYFGKSARDLNLAECAMLAGLPQAPSRYSPFTYPERAKKRQIYVLNRMVSEGYITRLQAENAINTPLDIHPRKNLFLKRVPYYTEYVRRLLVDRFGKDDFYSQGYQVYTCVDIDMQNMAREAMEKGLRALDKRQGYRGPITHLTEEQIERFSRDLEAKLSQSLIHQGMITKGVVIRVDSNADTVLVRMGNQRGVIALKDMRWARKPDPSIESAQAPVTDPAQALSVGDVILVRVKAREKEGDLWTLALEQTPEVQSALLCMEAGTGFVRAMVGGRDFTGSQFNRAIQSQRQPGSAFKPIIYAAALDKGYTPATGIVDSPVVFEDTDHDFTWKPNNYDNTFHGFTLFREGLIKSRNVITVKILRDIGIDYTIGYARKLGITSHLDKDLSLALGSSGVSLLELVNAYSVFANGGYQIPDCFIKKIVDRNGNVIFENQPTRKKVIDESTAYIITHLMEKVVQQGTGWRVRELNRPVAGKTGTTNNLNDAWFVGYTPEYITGVWVGFDHEKTLGIRETGSRAASPIWLKFMQRALEGKPVRVFPVPNSVVFAKIDADTGLLPVPESKNVIFECFKEGTVPSVQSPQPDVMVTDTDEFFKQME